MGYYVKSSLWCDGDTSYACPQSVVSILYPIGWPSMKVILDTSWNYSFIYVISHAKLGSKKTYSLRSKKTKTKKKSNNFNQTGQNPSDSENNDAASGGYDDAIGMADDDDKRTFYWVYFNFFCFSRVCAILNELFFMFNSYDYWQVGRQYFGAVHILIMNQLFIWEILPLYLWHKILHFSSTLSSCSHWSMHYEIKGQLILRYSIAVVGEISGDISENINSPCTKWLGSGQKIMWFVISLFWESPTCIIQNHLKSCILYVISLCFLIFIIFIQCWVWNTSTISIFTNVLLECPVAIDSAFLLLFNIAVLWLLIGTQNQEEFMAWVSELIIFIYSIRLSCYSGTYCAREWICVGVNGVSANEKNVEDIFAGGAHSTPFRGTDTASVQPHPIASQNVQNSSPLFSHTVHEM